jgi:tRNA(adenine34) deaminase
MTADEPDASAAPNMDAEVDAHFMIRALELARRAVAAGEVPVGALVVRDRVILGEAFNSPITRCDPSAHAEILAMREAAQRAGNYRLSGATLYVTIEPCAMCAGALVHARIARVVFAAREPRAGAVVSNMALLDQSCLNHRVSWSEGVCADEAAKLMSEFFRRKRG